MESAFAWIGQLMEWLGRLVPRIEIVRSTHAGVKFVRGHKVVPVGPGIVWYWPIVTDFVSFPTARQTNNLASQVMMTKDRQQVVVGAVIVYTITDIEQALSANWDVDDTIRDITQTAVVRVITGWPLEELHDKIADNVERELTKETKKLLKPFGVEVHKCALTDFSTCRVIKLISDAGVPT